MGQYLMMIGDDMVMLLSVRAGSDDGDASASAGSGDRCPKMDFVSCESGAVKSLSTGSASCVIYAATYLENAEILS